jgi:hypothetical protein
MNKLKATGAALFAAIFVAAFPAPARADDWNRRSTFRFSAPVEVPGKVLMPGTYVFKLFDSDSDRNIVQIFDKHETHVIATLLAVPDFRIETPDKPEIIFEERAAGAPEAIREWFSPSDNYGVEFIYPAVQPTD